MQDYHIHPNYSIDAEPVSMMQYCQRAVELGLREICFTTHCEFDPTRSHLDWLVRCRGQLVPMHPEGWLDSYFREAAECAAAYLGQGLNVRAGLEAGYDLGLEEAIQHLLTQYPFDFVIGSVHCLDHVAISSGREGSGYFPGKSPAEVGRAYYRTLREAVNTGLFDVVGHLDIYRRHGARILGEEMDTLYREYIDEVISLMCRTDTGMEINTSSLRHEQGFFYPSKEIIKRAVEAGIRHFTVGSDCHRLSELGLGVSQAIAEVNKLGIAVSVYSKRQPKPLVNDSKN